MSEHADKLSLITSRTQEILGMEQLQKMITDHQSIKVYFGTAPTGRIHIGYLVPLLKIADLLRAGCEIKILFADLHAVLDNLKTTPELIDLRTTYYESMIKVILDKLNVPVENLTFVRGSSYQLTSNYTSDVYKIAALTSIHDVKKAGSEVVKQSDNPKLSGLLYPILQALDEQYLDVDVELGGIDQRKLFTFAQDVLPLLGYKKRVHLMTPMLTAIDAKPQNDDSSEQPENISEKKMSSSNLNSKIDMIDSKNEIKKKINRAYCLEGDINFNPMMDMMKLIIFPLLQNLGQNIFLINRAEKHGGPIEYKCYEDLERDFVDKKLHPQDLKFGISDCLNNFIEPIRTQFSSKENQQLLKKAYPQ